MKQKFLSITLTMLSIVLLEAAIPLPTINNNEIVINNITEKQLNQNPSNTYTIQAQISPMCADILKDSLKAFIVIDGQRHPMIKDRTSSNTYTYDFKMPSDANVARYYFCIDYSVTLFEGKKERNIKSSLYDLQLTNRYLSTLDINRGFVGSTITLTGRGFTESDTILFGTKETETHYISDHIIDFLVPVLPAGKTYKVTLQGNRGSIPIGEFKIDFANVRADSNKITLKPKERITIAFEIQNSAPAGGIELDITTSIPDSVIMPEVTIPAGSKRVTVTIEGGQPGNGQLFIGGEGFEELVIPVSISSDESNFKTY